MAVRRVVHSHRLNGHFQRYKSELSGCASSTHVLNQLVPLLFVHYATSYDSDDLTALLNVLFNQSLLAHQLHTI